MNLSGTNDRFKREHGYGEPVSTKSKEVKHIQDFSPIMSKELEKNLNNDDLQLRGWQQQDESDIPDHAQVASMLSIIAESQIQSNISKETTNSLNQQKKRRTSESDHFLNMANEIEKSGEPEVVDFETDLSIPEESKMD